MFNQIFISYKGSINTIFFYSLDFRGWQNVTKKLRGVFDSRLEEVSLHERFGLGIGRSVFSLLGALETLWRL